MSARRLIGAFEAAPESLHDTPRAVEAPAPVNGAHVLDTYRGSRLGCMDEAMVSQIDPYVRVGAPLGVVEDEVARFKSRSGHVFSHSALREGVVRQLNAEGLAVHVSDQAAAVEAGLGRLSATPIRHPGRGERLKHELRAARRRLRWSRAAADDQNAEKQRVAAHN
jgi:hypothetical protein